MPRVLVPVLVINNARTCPATPDPDGFARLGVLCESNPRLHRLDRSHSFNQLARTLIHNGGRLADITVADCVEAYRAQVGYTARQQSFYVAAELMAQCRTSVAYRYNEPVNPASNIPTFRGPSSQMRNLAELAQALKWVFCYRYQSCEDPGWPTTFAYHYTERLRVELENRIINCYATTWDYDGGHLTI